MREAWPRGSEWRKWDLHVHSPESPGFKGTWRDFMVQLGFAECDVIGVNDYFSVAGYVEVMRRLERPTPEELLDDQYRAALEALRRKALLPVVELRMNNLAVGKKASGTPRFNFHVVFSSAVSTRSIESLIRSHRTQGQSIGDRYDRPADLLDISVSFDEFMNDLSLDAAFKDAYLIWLPYDEYGGIDPIDPKSDPAFKANLIQRAHILGSGNEKQSDYFLWRDPKYTRAEFESWFGRPKPCIKGSDSHDATYAIGRLQDESSQATNRYCWIKADPTFNGLRQIVNEPEHRVYIGTVPPNVEHVQTNATKYIRNIRVKSVDPSVRGWFDIDLPLNVGMVAVIGNKGSGKSALADILALAANTHCPPERFSFLTASRFRERNNRLAGNFEAQLEWADGRTSTSRLSADAKPGQVERAQYVPQAYLETICTENEPGDRSGFQGELQKVIFSHVPESDRLGCPTLEDLIDRRTSELNAKLVELRAQLQKLNERIVKGEKWLSKENLSSLENRLREKKEELKALDAAKPEEVAPPQSLSIEEQAAYEDLERKLDEARIELESTDKSIAEARVKLVDTTQKLELLGRLFERIEAIERYVEAQKKASIDEMAGLDLRIDEAVELRIDTSNMKARREALQREKQGLDGQLSPHNSLGLVSKRGQLANTLKTLQDRVAAPAKAYQTYLGAVKKWQEKRAAIEGAPDQPGTRAFIEAQVADSETKWPALLQGLTGDRRQLAEEIHETLSSIRQVYQNLFGPVQSFINETADKLGGEILDFATRMEQRGFVGSFLANINQGVNGSFCGKEQGESRIRSLLSSPDFDRVEDALAFADTVEAHLLMDHRNDDRSTTVPQAQLRKGVELTKLYDYLWGFEYLTPSYTLRFGGKDLQQLSPGERGTLLLLFYLLVDRNDVPIIVDQPEENLDNHTVYRLLIPVIKQAKARRQIIMVTHNPNVAVVCDAEQIVHASIDRKNSNRVTYTSGAIEDPAMNRLLLDVLEGTRPAFRNRRDKYHDA